MTPTNPPADDDSEDEPAFVLSDDGPVVDRADTLATPTGEPRETAASQTVSDVEATVTGGSSVWKAAQAAAPHTVIQQYISHSTGIPHRHKPSKHDVVDKYGFNPDFVASHLRYAPDDHAALHEIVARRSEFIDADEPVFLNPADFKGDVWSAIDRKREVARVPPEVYEFLDIDPPSDDE